MSEPRIKIPQKIVRGEVFEIKTIVSHLMESGQRKDKKTGERIPRKILNAFVCRYNGEEIFRAALHPAISANPYLSFYARATQSGELAFSWVDDDGSVIEHKVPITVEDGQ